MLPDIVVNILDSTGSFSDIFKNELEQNIHKEFYKAKQIVHAAGQIESALYILESGFARSYYYDHNGQDHTVKFWTVGEIIFSHEGYYRVSSFYYTEFLEASKVIVLGYGDLISMQKTFAETSALMKQTILKYRREEYERQHILTLSANERYEKLLAEKSILFQKSPAKYIASFLNMSRETLARLMGRR